MEAVGALTLVSGRVEEELMIRNEYLATENRILKSKLIKPVHYNDNEWIHLAKTEKEVGLKALKDISYIGKPETILKWFRKLVAKKFDGAYYRQSSGSGYDLAQLYQETSECHYRL